MRQITAYKKNWTNAILLSKSIAFAVILSVYCSLVTAESDKASQELVAKINQPSHTVVVGDTLWNVALRLRPQGMAMAQAMDVVYENNPQAFLDGDSTKLIEGSVVVFPTEITVVEAPQAVVSEENSSLIIPKVELTEEQVDESTELLSQDSNLEQGMAIDKLSSGQSLIESEINLESENKAQESPLVEEQSQQLPMDNSVADDRLLLMDNRVQDVEAEVQVEPPIVQPIQIENTEISQPIEVESVPQAKQLLPQQTSHDFNQYMAKIRQLPVDIWFFVAAILIAIIINKSKRKSSNQPQSEQADDLLAESVLDGPFAEGDGQDDVFTAVVEQPAKAKDQDKPQRLDEAQQTDDEAIDLPGLDELKAQLSEDNEQEKPLAKDYQPVSFEEDSFEIDPLQIKLDMASLCIEMGDIESAQSILEEIISEADKQGKAKAREILNSIET
jgi:FimV-like protein